MTWNGNSNDERATANEVQLTLEGSRPSPILTIDLYLQHEQPVATCSQIGMKAGRNLEACNEIYNETF